MKKPTRLIRHKGSYKTRGTRDIYKLLNVNYLVLTNKTYSTGVLDLPALYCNTKVIPDYLALYNQPSDYHKTNYTCICFYNFDDVFDGLYGLFNAIYYNNQELLDFYKERFKGVRYFISPDYSQFGDFHKIENLYRLWKSRIVSLWFIFELNAIVIPNGSYISEDTFPIYYSGFEDCSVIAFSTKGHIRKPNERRLLKKAVEYCVDHLNLKTIVVYSVCRNDSLSLELFQYAIDHGIRVVIPDNALRNRNKRRCAI